MENSLHLLIVEDSEDDTALLLEALRERGYLPVHQRVETSAQMKTALRQNHRDLIISDYTLPRFDAPRAMRLMKEAGLDIPFIIVTGSVGEETAVTAMKAEAHDYLMKDNLSRLSPAIEREMQETARGRKHRKAELDLQESEEHFRQLAESIQEVFWMKDFQANKVIYVSPSYKRIWGRSRKSLYEDPDSFVESIHPKDRRRVISALTKIPLELYDIEYRIVHPDGSVRWIRDRAFPIRNEKGEIYRIAGIAEEMTERKRSNEKLKASRRQLRALAARLDSIREKERAWISREIHDELGQIFTSIKFELSHLKRQISKLDDRLGEAKPELDEKLKSASNLLDSGIKTVQKIATRLRPGILDDLGLMAALEWQASEFQQRTGVLCRLDSNIQTIPLNRERATAVFRIFQEILTNVARHANATRVEIRIRRRGGDLLFDVKDNGRGITKKEISDPKSLGLFGMRERALLLDGEMRLRGIPKKGTSLRLRIPFQEGAEDPPEAAPPQEGDPP